MFFKSIFKSIKTFNWRLWLVLATTLLIPALYQTIRIFFLGDMPNDWGINIASQLSWLIFFMKSLKKHSSFLFSFCWVNH